MAVIKKIILLNKKEGETPLEALEIFRSKNKGYKDVPMTYAGRLDPMASGLLLILSGEKTKDKDKYLALDKEYEFEVLFGFATDTYDILGKVVHSNILTNIGMKNLGLDVKKNLKYFIGIWQQKYPLYSSPNIKKVRAGKSVEEFKREVTVKSLKLLGIQTIGSKQLLKNIEKRISKVKGDFRQEEILKIWKKNLSLEKREEFFLAKFRIKCGSGTYIRGIANSLGQEMGLSALAYSIKRTKLGKWSKISVL